MKRLINPAPNWCWINPSIIILFAVVLRLVPHVPNFAPISGMALFGGVYLNKKYALAVPLIAMFLSDIFLGFHNVMVFVYGSFVITGLMGLWLRKHKNFTNIVAATCFSSLLFFLITNFGVWLEGRLYPTNLSGLIESYTMAIPFFRNTIFGDLFYVTLFFGSYELALGFFRKSAFSNL
jgi:hypothetical protein